MEYLDKLNKITLVLLSVAFIAVLTLISIRIVQIDNKIKFYEDGGYIITLKDGQQLKGCLPGQLCDD